MINTGPSPKFHDARDILRVQGHHHQPALRAALDAHFKTVTPACDTAVAA